LGQTDKAEAALGAVASQGKNMDLSRAARLRELIQFIKSPDQLAAGEGRLQAILSANPAYSPALLVAGLLEEKRGAPADARRRYEKILQADPGFVPAAKRLAWLHLEKFDDAARAFEFASRARQSAPDDAELAGVMGRVLLDRSDYANAVPLLREYARARATDAEAHFLLGKAQYRSEDRLGSRDTLKRALELGPGAPFAEEAKQLMSAFK